VEGGGWRVKSGEWRVESGEWRVKRVATEFGDWGQNGVRPGTESGDWEQNTGWTGDRSLSGLTLG
jgi:hypothetical protein